ncbi:hypothetical protein [Paractinoplanes globisporus]|uniref:Arginase n=1 Tax=Paractinoplanes globisporus TaxID=113565 RepID=A0ABW6WCJ0_9ACTN|nr:hypothetical protein [Actinoplanes globisporus]
MVGVDVVGVTRLGEDSDDPGVVDVALVRATMTPAELGSRLV